MRSKERGKIMLDILCDILKCILKMFSTNRFMLLFSAVLGEVKTTTTTTTTKKITTKKMITTTTKEGTGMLGVLIWFHRLSH